MNPAIVRPKAFVSPRPVTMLRWVAKYLILLAPEFPVGPIC